jgi:phosphoglycolate phosphatase
VGDTDVVGDLLGRLIAFDLDGTLIDSRRDLADAANQLITERGGAPLSEEAIGRMVGEGARVLVERALRAAGIENQDGALPRFLAIYDEHLLNHTRPYHGIADAVAAARSHARVAVLTNKPSRATERILDGLGLRALFDDVIASDESWPRKPDPASLQELMRRAGATPAAALLVGDSAIDHETARRAGARCCLARYGFGFHTLARERLAGTEWIVSTPAELPDVFARFTAA